MPQSVSQSRPNLPMVEQVLLAVLFLGGIAMLSLPAARGASATFGWMPLWLLGLPAIALATAVLLRRSRRDASLAIAVQARRRRQAAPVSTVPRRAAGAARRLRRPQAA